MTNETPNVIAFGYAKRAFNPTSRERRRLKEYSDVMGSFHLVVFVKKEEGLPDFVNDGNLTIYATNAKTKIGALYVAYRYGRNIIKNNPNITWTVSSQDPLETSVPALLLSMIFKKAYLHIQIHGDVFNKKFHTKNYYSLLLQRYSQWVVKRARKIRVVSTRIKNDLMTLGVQPQRIVVVPIQAELEQFLAVGSLRTYQRNTLTKLLYVGRFSKEKNITLLLEAVASVHKENIAISLQLLGEGSKRIEIESTIKRLGICEIVTFVPWTDDVPSIMAKADVFCLSSWHEGFSMVLIEAMAAGMPIISTDVGCVGEYVINGEEGLVVPPGDVGGYADCIKKLLLDADLQEKLGRSGYLKAKTIVLSSEMYLQEIKKSFTV